MKITNGLINNGIRSARNEAAEKKSGSSPEKARGTSADSVVLSLNLREVGNLAKMAAAMPGADAEKIESIRNSIADGTYSVSGYQVAEKMLRGMGILKDGDLP